MSPPDEQTQIDDADMENGFRNEYQQEAEATQQPVIDPALTQDGVDEDWRRFIENIQDPPEPTVAPRDLTADADMQFLNALTSPGPMANAPSDQNVGNGLVEHGNPNQPQPGNYNGDGAPEWIFEQIAPGEQPGLPMDCPNCPFHHRATLCAVPRGLPLTYHIDCQFCGQPHHSKIWCVEMLQPADRADQMDVE